MKKFALLLVASVLFGSGKTEVQAQVPYVTYYQPATVYSPPVAFAPHAVYYSPVIAAPVIAAPVIAAPVIAAPVIAAPAYQPVTRIRTRYRPILGRAVTRVQYGYAPTYYAPSPVVYAY